MAATVRRTTATTALRTAGMRDVRASTTVQPSAATKDARISAAVQRSRVAQAHPLPLRHSGVTSMPDRAATSAHHKVEAAPTSAAAVTRALAVAVEAASTAAVVEAVDRMAVVDGVKDRKLLRT